MEQQPVHNYDPDEERWLDEGGHLAPQDTEDPAVEPLEPSDADDIDSSD